MFHILGDCYLQKKSDILVLRPSSQNGEKLQFINYFLFRMENKQQTHQLTACDLPQCCKQNCEF